MKRVKWYSRNAWVGLGTALVGALVAFGVPLTRTQQGASLVLLGTLASFLGADDA